MFQSNDSVLRAITDDGAFRVITARTTETVRAAVSAQQASGRTARHFGDLITAAILFRETMAPQLRVQGIIRGARGRGSLVADSHPSGKTRGLIQLPKDASEIDVGPGAVLQLMRTLPSGRISQGIVQVPESGSISEALMVYMQVSEQVVSMLALATLMGERDVQCAGGYLVQLLPEVGRGPLTVMTERLEGFQSVEQPLREASFTPRRLLDQLLSGMPFTPLEESAVGFGCWCDRLRLLSALATLKRADLTELVASGELLEVRCDYCGLEYQIAPAELRGLLEKS